MLLIVELVPYLAVRLPLIFIVIVQKVCCVLSEVTT